MWMVSACGFSPVYQTNNDEKTPQVFKLSIAASSNDNAYTAYKLRREIETLLPTIPMKTNRPVTLKIKLSEDYGDIAYSSQANTLRRQGQLRARIELFDKTLEPFYVKDLDVVSSSTVDYQEEFALMAAEQGARERLVKSLAIDIVHELALAPFP
jgi:hypothetical protein